LYENCTGGITGYIDRIIFTDKHLYQYPTCQLVYGTKKKQRFRREKIFHLGCKPPYDPENLLGAIPTMFLAFLGVQAGRILGLKT
jgi:heparan-alpha-glucosaminide N-acetyltransferase